MLERNLEMLILIPVLGCYTQLQFWMLELGVTTRTRELSSASPKQQPHGRLVHTLFHGDSQGLMVPCLGGSNISYF